MKMSQPSLVLLLAVRFTSGFAWQPSALRRSSPVAAPEHRASAMTAPSIGDVVGPTPLMVAGRAQPLATSAPVARMLRESTSSSSDDKGISSKLGASFSWRTCFITAGCILLLSTAVFLKVYTKVVEIRRRREADRKQEEEWAQRMADPLDDVHRVPKEHFNFLKQYEEAVEKMQLVKLEQEKKRAAEEKERAARHEEEKRRFERASELEKLYNRLGAETRDRQEAAKRAPTLPKSTCGSVAPAESE